MACPDEDWPVKTYADLRDPDTGVLVSIPEMYRPGARPGEAPVRSLEDALALRAAR